jgi:PadR family transcriptional regulator, regulatory protein AphA
MAEPELAPLSYLVLGLIDQAGEVTPYELKLMAASMSGLWTLRHDQVYREPERLAKLGLLVEEREQSGRRRRRFRITPEGRTVLEQWLRSPTAEFTELRDAGLLQLFLGADPVPLAQLQLDAHEERLREYEELRKNLADQAPEGVLLTLKAGIGHEREWVRFWRELVSGEADGYLGPA